MHEFGLITGPIAAGPSAQTGPRLTRRNCLAREAKFIRRDIWPRYARQDKHRLHLRPSSARAATGRPRLEDGPRAPVPGHMHLAAFLASLTCLPIAHMPHHPDRYSLCTSRVRAMTPTTSCVSARSEKCVARLFLFSTYMPIGKLVQYPNASVTFSNRLLCSETTIFLFY